MWPCIVSSYIHAAHSSASMLYFCVVLWPYDVIKRHMPAGMWAFMICMNYCCSMWKSLQNILKILLYDWLKVFGTYSISNIMKTTASKLQMIVVLLQWQEVKITLHLFVNKMLDWWNYWKHLVHVNPLWKGYLVRAIFIAGEFSGSIGR